MERRGHRLSLRGFLHEKALRGFDSPLLDLWEDIELKHKPRRENPVDED